MQVDGCNAGARRVFSCAERQDLQEDEWLGSRCLRGKGWLAVAELAPIELGDATSPATTGCASVQLVQMVQLVQPLCCRDRVSKAQIASSSHLLGSCGDGCHPQTKSCLGQGGEDWMERSLFGATFSATMYNLGSICRDVKRDRLLWT